MKRVCLEYLTPGMVLAKDVTGIDGNVYLAAGAALDAAAIDGLKTLGLPEAAIAYPPGQPDKDTEHAWLAAYVRNFFVFVDPDSAHLEALYRTCVDRAEQALAAGWRLPCEYELRARHLAHGRRRRQTPRPLQPRLRQPRGHRPPRDRAGHASPTLHLPPPGTSSTTRPAPPTTSPASWPPTSA